MHAVVSENSITTRAAGAEHVGDLQRTAIRSAFWALNLQDSLMNLIKLTLVSLAGWMNQQQQDVIEYLQEEVRVLKEQQGSKRV